MPPRVRVSFSVFGIFIIEAVYRPRLIDKYGGDDIYYWRTADGNEVDFVLPEIETPFAVEAKYDEATIKSSKYNKFTEEFIDGVGLPDSGDF